jgi:hypothetical protein
MNTFAVFPAPEGRLVHEATDYDLSGPAPVPVRRVTVMSADEDTVGAVEYPLERPPAPFQATPFIVYAPGHGILASPGSDPILEWYDLDGRLRRRIRFDVPPDPVTAEQRSRIKRTASERLESEVDERRRRSIRERMQIPIPETRAWWIDAVVDEDGYIWAEPPWSHWYVDPSEVTYRVVSPAGEYLGRTPLPQVDADSVDLDLSRGRLILRYLDRVSGAPVVEVYAVDAALTGFEYP